MVAEVRYSKDGKDESKKIMSFAAPDVYTTLSGYTSFPVDVNVVMKKEGNFWNWKAIESPNQKGTSSDGPAAATTNKTSNGRVLGSNYETPEERARRQVYIIRQSSVSSAIEFAKAQSPKGIEKALEAILEDASKIEAFVMKQAKLADKPE